MNVKRHMYHYEGMTDLAQLRRDAQRAGEPVLIHLHPYTEEFGGCAYLPSEQLRDHELVGVAA